MKNTLLFSLIIFCISCHVAQAPSSSVVAKQYSPVDSIFTHTPTLKEDIHSFLVAKEGKLLAEYYYNGFTADSLNNVKSITKSIVGLLTGIAIEQGAITGLDVPATSFFEECNKSKLFIDKSKITIEDLLLMRSGIEWDNRSMLKNRWWYNESPHCFLLDSVPVETEPNQQFSYNSADAHLLSGILSRSTGKSTLAFAQEHLFSPLGITHLRWSTDRNGEYLGNSELYLLPRDMLRLGEILLQGGVYKEKQIIPAEWVKLIHGKAQPATSLMDYGYLWMTSTTEEPYFYFAGGSGGQHIFIVPSKEMVIVTTGHWDNARSTREIMQVVVSEIIAKN